jgi:hypothetical protein
MDVQPYSFLASLPALLGFCGFIVYQFLGSRGKGEPITQKIVEKLRREAPGAVAPDKRLAPAQVERLLHGNQKLQKLVGEQDFLLLQQALKQQFVITIVVYLLAVSLCILSVILFVRQSQESKALHMENVSLSDTSTAAGQHLVDLDALQGQWHASGEPEDVQAYVENVQTGARSEALSVPSSQGSVSFETASYRPVLTDRTRGGKNRIRLVLQSRKATFKSDVKDLEVGITVLTLLDGDARLTVAAMIDNSRIAFYDFRAKIMVPGRNLATAPLSVGEQILYQAHPLTVRRPAQYDWDEAKGVYFGPDDAALVRFQFLIDHSVTALASHSH